MSYRALIVDTETSGLFKFGKENPADGPGQPRMCSLGAILLNADGSEAARMHRVAYPDDWVLDDNSEAAKINNFTHQRLMDEGIPISGILGEYDALVDECDLIVGFSLAFDQKMIRAEQRRAGRPDRYGDRDTFDTMYASKKVTSKIPGKGNVRKLGAVYEAIFGREIEGAHDALVDCAMTRDIYKYLLNDGLVIPKKQKALY